MRKKRHPTALSRTKKLKVFSCFSEGNIEPKSTKSPIRKPMNAVGMEKI